VTNVHRELEKEKIELENILQDRIHFARKNEKGYIEKIRVLREKCKCIVERRDAEKKYLLDLEKNFRDMNKTASQRKGCRKGNFRDVPLSVQ
jgi:chromosome segregation ATPase